MWYEEGQRERLFDRSAVLTTEENLRLLALCKIKGVSWHLLAREASVHPDGLGRLLAAKPREVSSEANKAAALIEASFSQSNNLLEQAAIEVQKGAEAGARLVTVLDVDYPKNLRGVFNLPPFLFIQGSVRSEDASSVAVVGTRKASSDGLRRASRMAELLTRSGVTVISGLAAGIDTAAHRAALAAEGRTIAVVGTGISRVFPAENQELAEQISVRGAVVSQFWPDAAPATYTFPRRNVTMSGIAQGSVVIEASHTSGAKMQARLALEHGKKVFLLRSLTNTQKWAEQYVRERGAYVVDDVSDILQRLSLDHERPSGDSPKSQLELDFG